jgi:anti-sigma factor RsiW
MNCSSSERESLTFLAAGTLEPAERAAALAHLEGCPECRAEWPALTRLVSGLRELHLTPEEVLQAAAGAHGPDHLALCESCRGEVARLRAVEASLRSKAVWPVPAWAASLAAGLLVALGGWLVLRGLAGPQVPPDSMRGGTPAPQPLLEKLPVKLSGASPALLEELGQALVPYRTDDYEEAARRLSVVAARHPRAAEPALYHGVVLLLLDRPREAIAPLERASSLAPEGELRADAVFHLALARFRAGEDAGRAALSTLCGAEGPYRAKACQASGGR